MMEEISCCRFHNFLLRNPASLKTFKKSRTLLSRIACRSDQEPAFWARKSARQNNTTIPWSGYNCPTEYISLFQKANTVLTWSVYMQYLLKYNGFQTAHDQFYEDHVLISYHLNQKMQIRI